MLKGMHDEERSSFLLTSAAMVVLLWEEKEKKEEETPHPRKCSIKLVVHDYWQLGKGLGHGDLE